MAIRDLGLQFNRAKLGVISIAIYSFIPNFVFSVKSSADDPRWSTIIDGEEFRASHVAEWVRLN